MINALMYNAAKNFADESRLKYHWQKYLLSYPDKKYSAHGFIGIWKGLYASMSRQFHFIKPLFPFGIVNRFYTANQGFLDSGDAGERQDISFQAFQAMGQEIRTIDNLGHPHCNDNVRRFFGD
jgi:hypothetical protein